MTVKVTDLFDKIWQQYLTVTPSAKKIHHLLGNGNDIINDHVAYRTFNIEKVNTHHGWLLGVIAPTTSLSASITLMVLIVL